MIRMYKIECDILHIFSANRTYFTSKALKRTFEIKAYIWREDFPFISRAIKIQHKLACRCVHYYLIIQIVLAIFGKKTIICKRFLDRNNPC